MPNKHIQIQLLHITYFYNSILLQYIVLFPIEAWSHVKQHNHEEITQYIAYICQLYPVK